MRKRIVVQRWEILAIYLSMIALSLASILYNTYSVRQSDQKWCDLLVSIDATRTQPTPESQLFHIRIHRLVKEFQCER